MLVEAKIRILKSILGAQPDRKASPMILRLKKTRDKNWDWDLDAVADGIVSAVKDLDLDCDPTDIIFPPSIELGQIVHHRRPFRVTGDKRMRAQEHEAISKGYVLTFTIRIRENGTLPTPDQKQLLQILEYVGQYEGLSEWGRERGYGRFKVESVRPVGRGSAAPGELPADNNGGVQLQGEADDPGGNSGELEKED